MLGLVALGAEVEEDADFLDPEVQPPQIPKTSQNGPDKRFMVIFFKNPALENVTLNMIIQYFR